MVSSSRLQLLFSHLTGAALTLGLLEFSHARHPFPQEAYKATVPRPLARRRKGPDQACAVGDRHYCEMRFRKSSPRRRDQYTAISFAGIYDEEFLAKPTECRIERLRNAALVVGKDEDEITTHFNTVALA